MSSVNSIASDKLARLIGTPRCPALLDVRADDDFSADPRLIPGSVRRSSETAGEWAAEFRGRSAVVICKKGLTLSHGVAALLREAGASAEVLEGGLAGRAQSGLSLVSTSTERPALSYCAIASHCRRDELGARVPALLDELLAWFERHGVAPNGPQMVRYRIVDYNTGNLDIEVGFPVQTEQRLVDPRILWGEIPAGRCVAVAHAGPYDSLVDTTAALLAWARANRVVLDVEDHEKVTQWGCRVERYLVAPPDESRPERWRTEIAILLSNAAGTGPTFNQPRNAMRKGTP